MNIVQYVAVFIGAAMFIHGWQMWLTTEYITDRARQNYAMLAGLGCVVLIVVALITGGTSMFDVHLH